MCLSAPTSSHFQSRIVELMAFTVFLSVLNGTMFNVAVPDIRRQFMLTPSEVSWVVTGYIVVFAMAAVTYGKLADIFPLRRLVVTGLLLFNAGALMGFFSSWAPYPVLVGARLIQASGGGAIPALSMLVATRYFPPELRGRVLGTMAATVAFAAGVGPIVGGFIAGSLHWRYLFLLSLVTVVSLFGFLYLLPREKKQAGAFDLTGGLLLAGAVAFLLWWVSRGPWELVPLGGLCVAGFFRHIHRTAHPFAPPALFGNLLYRNGLATVFLAVGPIFGMFFAVPLMLRSLHGLSTLHIGLVIFPGAMSAALLGFLGGRLADRKGSVLMVYLGLGLLFMGFVTLAGIVKLNPRLVSLALIICYTGFSFIQSSLAKAVSTTLPPKRTGVGMGLYNLIFFTAGAFGAALTGRLLEIFLQFRGEAVATPFDYQAIFLLSAATIVLAFAIFFRAYRSQHGPDRDRSVG